MMMGEATDKLRHLAGERQLQRQFGSDQSVWRGGDWNGFVRIAVAGFRPLPYRTLSFSRSRQ